MLIVMDIGNTNTVIGVYQGDKLLSDWRIRTEKEVTIDELGMLLRNLFQSQGLVLENGTDFIISCVVPPMVNTLEGFALRYLKSRPLWVGPGIKTGMPIHYDNPREVGADRIVNAVAAYDQVKGAVIVVDFGTATTFDVISQQGEYLGGAIAPGVMISCEALFIKASKLPRVEIFAKPKSIIAKDTISSMNAGIIYGYVGLVDGIVTRMKQALGDPKVIATGGLACLIASETQSIDVVDDYLTLKGLKIIYERNRPRREERDKGGGMSEVDWDIGHRYLKETRYTRVSLGEPRAVFPRAEPYKEYPAATQTVKLDPQAGRVPADLWECLNLRRSQRRYTDRPLTVAELAALVWATQGISLVSRNFLFRTAPSAGALYPVETYLAVHRVDGVDTGIWHLNVQNFELELLSAGDYRRPLVEAGLAQNFLGTAAVVFLWTGILNRAIWKYRERAIRYLFLDAGHICQNLQLAATALGLGCCPVGAFFDDEVERLVGVDGHEEVALYMAGVGPL